MKTLEDLAIILGGIHSHKLYPFYSERKRSAKRFWSTLEYKTKIDTDVDQKFFYSIAEMIVQQFDVTIKPKHARKAGRTPASKAKKAVRSAKGGRSAGL